MTLDFSRPGKPTDNAYIESLNGKFRTECLNANWFQSLDEARRKCEVWRRGYNEQRPHSALGQKVPQVLHPTPGPTGRPIVRCSRIFSAEVVQGWGQAHRWPDSTQIWRRLRGSSHPRSREDSHEDHKAFNGGIHRSLALERQDTPKDSRPRRGFKEATSVVTRCR